MFGRKSSGRLFSGVVHTLTATHRDRVTGHVHGHVWEVTAWFAYGDTDQRVYQYQLDEVLKQHEDTCLPDNIAWGEALAQWVGESINHARAHTCVAVDVKRHAERIYARWEA